ncbi:hypothetical protein CA85_05740 [Allorhodopirellula solitaria]|uniref:DUF1573 domain-containing protein n=2 Tax=Allorhodopirellula solitaria TaxID=2527987 RepID=A0A5C5YK92_9BACT|nr:hypothetical protein CA85_05740 [Allorhodopirellula solitaria]
MFLQKPVVVITSSSDLTAATSGELTDLSVTLRNTSNRDINIIGSSLECNCHLGIALPAKLPSGQVLCVPFKSKIGRAFESTTKPVYFYLDHPEQISVKIQVVGTFPAH